ncbi:MAG: zinc-ribbon domain-containing protein, partial [Oscillospiraceae bacterium]|nr:zinc-ribbon domain-containing protein [Oscillospiraceae bacterium]
PSMYTIMPPVYKTYGSNKLVWWIGRCGHEWHASPKSRHAGENCP